jgi:hypothetical protein
MMAWLLPYSMAQIVLLDRYGARRSMHACLPLLRSRAARSDEGKARMQARTTWEAAIGSSGAGTRELIGRSGGPRIRRVALAVARSGSRWTTDGVQVARSGGPRGIVWKRTDLVTPLHLPRRGSGIKMLPARTSTHPWCAH